ncbi:hypothetical protein BGW42_002769 [Actinomortierella wolfii]|nr:hypothetical protein BGW42_002769 [Actinomortierella wolfii]KAG0233903.1 hypothetical protein BGW41_001344 [Actinomortierella wolfii]
MASTLYYKAIASIAAYFTTVLSALFMCIARTRLTASNAIYILIAVASLFTTWYYILSWFHVEYVALGSNIDRFILESDLFVKAYAIVTDNLTKWWWSSQLLICTGTLLTYWSVESQSLRIEVEEHNHQNRTKSNFKKRTWTPTWWFVLLGFFGSMSVGGPMLLAQLDSDDDSNSNIKNKSAKKRNATCHTRSVPGWLVLAILLGEISVILTPFFDTSDKRFTINLMLTHVFFLIPALFQFDPRLMRGGWSGRVALPHLYILLALIALTSQFAYTLPFLPIGGSSGLTAQPVLSVKDLYKALWDNHCQTSISADLMFNNLLAAIVMIRTSAGLGKSAVGWILTALMPLLSVSTVLPLFLAWKERQVTVGSSATAKTLEAAAKIGIHLEQKEQRHKE